MSDNILIFGKGFFGTRLSQDLGARISEKRINSVADALGQIEKYSPSIIINAIGHIGSNVDECENDVDRTLSANSFAPLMLLEAAIRSKVRLVHVSSGCIFEYDYGKDKPLSEGRKPDFFRLFYSRTKIYSETALERLSEKFGILIVRPRVPLDAKPHPKNLLNKLIKYGKVIDLPNSVTYIPDFTRAVKHLIKVKASGIFNVVNKGGLRFPKLMDIYARYNPGFKYEVIDFKKLNMVRTNLLLSTKKLEDAGFKVRHIDEVLEECVREYVKYS